MVKIFEEGVVGSGDTPDLATRNFDHNWYSQNISANCAALRSQNQSKREFAAEQLDELRSLLCKLPLRYRTTIERLAAESLMRDVLALAESRIAALRAQEPATKGEK